MTSDMIERVARAIYRQRAASIYPTRPDEVERAVNESWQLCRDEACAAIEALIAPTDAMIDAGAMALFESGRSIDLTMTADGDARLAYCAMIEAALGGSDGA